MAMFRYRNESKNDLMIVNVGVVKAGDIIESDTVIENPNLVKVGVEAETPVKEKPQK